MVLRAARRGRAAASSPGLAVFRGGCTLEAAEEVAGADLDTLQSLVEKSLLRHTDERFWMLETIREYALERLSESSDEAELRRRHAVLALDFAESTYQEMEGGGDRATMLHGSTSSATTSAPRSSGRATGQDDVLLRLAARSPETGPAGARPGRGHVEWAALERPWSRVESRMLLLRRAAGLAAFLGNYARSDAMIAEWRGLAEEQGDEPEVLLAMNSAALNASEQGEHETGARNSARSVRGRRRSVTA